MKIDIVIDDYIDHLLSARSGDMSSLHIVIDENGVASMTASKLFSKLGIKYELINNNPNENNISVIERVLN